MITEDYVNKEIALLLREKRFDELTLYHYNGDNKEHTHTIDYDLLKNSELKEFCSAAPTIQMAMKWLREVHNIDITITPDYKENYTAMIFVNRELPFTEIGSFKTYKAACEAAIKYALENLI